ncbi:hypothetical protein ACN3E9_13055 [Vibrio pectenicida]|uniref:hypothetical protein n=1 Tax=Vibrio pectenicida TaxID=62763 RepID=UPI003B9D5A59
MTRKSLISSITLMSLMLSPLALASLEVLIAKSHYSGPVDTIGSINVVKNVDISRDTLVESQALKPRADYLFNNSKKSKLLVERDEVIQSSKLTYDGEVYSVAYAMETSDDYLMLMKSNHGSRELVLQAPLKAEENSKCLIGTSYNRWYIFDCSKEQVSNNQDLITYNGIYEEKSFPTMAVSPDIILELHEGIGNIGSTELKLDFVGSAATITTQSPFSVYFGSDVSTDLGVTTYYQIKNLVNKALGREITLVFDSEIDGSSDDEINMYTGLFIREAGIHTKINQSGSVFSGGTDLFTAGKTRTLELNNSNVSVEENEQVGIHSWAEIDSSGKIIEATSIPYTNEAHRAQATYFQHMLGDIGIDFYLFTLESAPHDGEHYMTRSELELYGVTTNVR